MSDARERIIDTACQLMESQGYHATGLNQIVRESGAPKGSLYYYFPNGKEELAAEAIRHTGQTVEARIRASLEVIADPAEAVRQFIHTLAGHMAASGYQAGGPITTVALESATTSKRINAVCQDVYTAWQAAFSEKLLCSGIDTARAVRLAALIVASLEGGIVLSRTVHSVEPLHNVAEEVGALIQSACG